MKFFSEVSFASLISLTTPFALQGHQHHCWMGPPTWNYYRNPTLKECEDDTHTPEMGSWESFRTPKNSEFDCKVKTPHLEMLFIPLERSQNVNVKNGIA
jgi:hypothetical protein